MLNLKFKSIGNYLGQATDYTNFHGLGTKISHFEGH